MLQLSEMFARGCEYVDPCIHIPRGPSWPVMGIPLPFICKGPLGIEFERDLPVALGATLGDVQKIKNYFSSFRDFSGKSR